LVRQAEARGLSSEPVFLFDEDLIAHGKSLSAIYPGTIHVSSHGDAPEKQTPDGQMYSWCIERGAIFVTADFNMLRDEAVLRDLLSHEGLRVIWVRQIKGQSVSREIERIVGRWTYIRSVVTDRPDLRAFVLAGNGRLVPYQTIGDAVVEVVNRRRSRRDERDLRAD
jgi:hypothetical protein